MAETIYRVVCPDGIASSDRILHHLADAVHELVAKDRQHGDCDGPHHLELAVWTPMRMEVNA